MLFLAIISLLLRYELFELQLSLKHYMTMLQSLHSAFAACQDDHQRVGIMCAIIRVYYCAAMRMDAEKTLYQWYGDI